MSSSPLYEKYPPIVPGESLDEFRRFAAELHEKYQPADAMEEQLFEYLVESAWRFRRVKAMVEGYQRLHPGDTESKGYKILTGHATRHEREFTRLERDFLQRQKRRVKERAREEKRQLADLKRWRPLNNWIN